ncbi:hypothetical protein [Paractinoplanes atraurantiacus]|uniref:Uncharacterized protein n=1 Tax=Paractinoplanes atraurantiacus TaxID=1036182 RepID=A0A285FTV2_9ACTN|nr:hypothetical protein [Actinoplanes atraurantiacus]SNY13641.1 hypothetical protein SAMN05421748_1011092 [Actinoplanes atraurantiacus]
MTVFSTLFRLYRPILLIFWGIMLVVEVIGLVVIDHAVGPNKFSFWIVMAGAAIKYWPLVAGILVISLHMKLFVANGITRGEFLGGMGMFAVGLTALFAALVVAGHAVESTLLGALDLRAATYPVFTLDGALSEFGHLLPGSMAYMVTGMLVTAGFYRWNPWIGVPLIIPGAIPLAVSDNLVRFDQFGETLHRLPYGPAVVITLTVVVAGFLVLYSVMRDTPIRRTSG